HRVDVGGARSGAEAVDRLAVEASNVPLEPAPLEHGLVREPVQLLDRQPLAVEAPERNPPALRTEVDCGEARHQFAVGRRRSRGRGGAAPRGPGSTESTATPPSRQRSTSSLGAVESVRTSASRSVGANESSALRCHFVPSTIPYTCSQASAI